MEKPVHNLWDDRFPTGSPTSSPTPVPGDRFPVPSPTGTGTGPTGSRELLKPPGTSHHPNPSTTPTQEAPMDHTATDTTAQRASTAAVPGLSRDGGEQ